MTQATHARHLPLGLKVALVAASFSLPIVVLVYFVVTNINADIRFSTLELAGNAYQRTLENLLDTVQQYQLAVTDSRPVATTTPQRETLVAQINSEFTALAKREEQYGVDLQFTDEGLKKRGREHLRASLLQEQWQLIASQRHVEPSAALDKLVASLREAITHAGDTSNLILDPDLDSYYLMDVTLLALPQSQDRLAKLIAFGRDRLQAGSIDAKDRVQFAVQAAMLEEADLLRVTASLRTSLNEDANFYGVSPTFASATQGASEEYQRTMNEFIELVRGLSVGDQSSVAPAAFVAAGEAAREASFSLWNVSVGELDRMLTTRVADYVTRRTVALTGSGAALGVACVLALLLTRSITRPLNALAQSLAPGADLLQNSVEMLSNSPENADIICEELGAQVGYMRRAVQQLVVVVRGGVEAEVVRPAAHCAKHRDLEPLEV